MEWVGSIYKNSLSNSKLLELKGGGKKMKWGEIIKDNAWYIDECFLLPNRVLSNPDRFRGDEVRAFWTHWYKLAESGQHFTLRGSEPISPMRVTWMRKKGWNMTRKVAQQVMSS